MTMKRHERAPQQTRVTVDSTTYTYNLRRIGTDRVFTVAFDLTREIEKPAPPWGWEDFEKRNKF